MPIDLLFYNFFMPSAVKYLRPSDGLYEMYDWWFRTCARWLRLTNFLFGERAEDEEGHYQRPWWSRLLLRARGGATGRAETSDSKVRAADFVRDGRFVRAPASDQVRVPKGQKAFQELNETDDTAAQRPTADAPRNGDADLYTKVYIPPRFGFRITAFILLIWIFAAATGVSLTIGPLLYGRKLLGWIVPGNLRMNDVYAYSIGFYLLTAVSYGYRHSGPAVGWARRFVGPERQSLHQSLCAGYALCLHLVGLAYLLVAFGFLLPILSALLVELYLIIPCHAYFAGSERHAIDLIQDWTLGVLYVKIAGRIVLWYPQSRPANALRAIVRRGWLCPDVRLATRSVILPTMLAMALAAMGPLLLGWIAIRLGVGRVAGLAASQIYRSSYPVVLAAVLAGCCIRVFRATVQRWKQGIRDEVYLVGQQLHNLGEGRGGTTL
jgi:E3 ubiquitin-protein ligase MARCH6